MRIPVRCGLCSTSDRHLTVKRYILNDHSVLIVHSVSTIRPCCVVTFVASLNGRFRATISVSRCSSHSILHRADGNTSSLSRCFSLSPATAAVSAARLSSARTTDSSAAAASSVPAIPLSSWLYSGSVNRRIVECEALCVRDIDAAHQRYGELFHTLYANGFHSMDMNRLWRSYISSCHARKPLPVTLDYLHIVIITRSIHGELKAPLIIRECIDYAIVPTERTIRILFDACALIKSTDETMTVLKFLREHCTHISVNAQLLTTVLQSFANNLDVSGAVLIYHEMQRIGIRPTLEVYQLLLQTFGGSKLMEASFTLFDHMRENGHSRLHSSLFEVLIEACVAAKYSAGAQQTFNKMRTLSELGASDAPTQRVYTLVIRSFLESGKLRDAHTLYREMRLSGAIIADESVFNSFLSAMTNDITFGLTEALDILNDRIHAHSSSPQNIPPPTTSSFNVLLTVAAKDQNINALMHLLDQMSLNKVNANIQTYSTLINATMLIQKQQHKLDTAQPHNNDVTTTTTTTATNNRAWLCYEALNQSTLKPSLSSLIQCFML